MSSLPHESSCWAGTVTRLDLNLFVEGDDAEAGETRLLRIKSLVVEAMASLGKDGDMLSADYLGSRDMMADEETDRWRSIIEYRVTAVTRKA